MNMKTWDTETQHWQLSTILGSSNLVDWHSSADRNDDLLFQQVDFSEDIFLILCYGHYYQEPWLRLTNYNLQATDLCIWPSLFRKQRDFTFPIKKFFQKNNITCQSGKLPWIDHCYQFRYIHNITRNMREKHISSSFTYLQLRIDFRCLSQYAPSSYYEVQHGAAASRRSGASVVVALASPRSAPQQLLAAE